MWNALPSSPLQIKLYDPLYAHVAVAARLLTENLPQHAGNADKLEMICRKSKQWCKPPDAGNADVAEQLHDYNNHRSASGMRSSTQWCLLSVCIMDP